MIQAAEFLAAFTPAFEACTRESARFGGMAGVRLEFTAEGTDAGLRVLGTDGRRIHSRMVEIQGSSAGNAEVTIPWQAGTAITKYLKSVIKRDRRAWIAICIAEQHETTRNLAPPAVVSDDDATEPDSESTEPITLETFTTTTRQWVYLSSCNNGDETIAVLAPEGRFPRWRDAIPSRDENTREFLLDVDSTRAAADSLVKLAKKGKQDPAFVTVTIDRDIVAMKADWEGITSEKTVSLARSADHAHAATFTIDIHYFAELLAAAPTEAVRLTYHGWGQGVLVQSETFLAVLMPIARDKPVETEETEETENDSTELPETDTPESLPTVAEINAAYQPIGQRPRVEETAEESPTIAHELAPTAAAVSPEPIVARIGPVVSLPNAAYSAAPDWSVYRPAPQAAAPTARMVYDPIQRKLMRVHAVAAALPLESTPLETAAAEIIPAPVTELAPLESAPLERVETFGPSDLETAEAFPAAAPTEEPTETTWKRVELRRSDPTVDRLVRAAYPDYKGRKVSATICRTVRFTGTNWDEGSKSYYVIVRVADLMVQGIQDAPYFHGSPLHETDHTIPTGFVVVERRYFRQYESIAIHAAPETVAPLLPPPSDLSDDEKVVLAATKNFKSSYGGVSDYRYREAHRVSGITRESWAAAKMALTMKGMLSANGAITPEGRNAIAG
ncbi:MAG TPA: hypothetical protein VNU68_07230 [Verrucomicrobiae bacterium]|nr:hypothetical protein [Verrucomicrobiae bacterium]